MVTLIPMIPVMTKRIRSGSSLVAVGYVRVSTDDQNLGPQAQRAAIESWAAREGVQVAAWHVDQGVSGPLVVVPATPPPPSEG